MPEARGTILIAIALIIGLIIGAGIGYAVWGAAPPAPPEVRTVTVTETTTVTAAPTPPTPEYTFYYVSHGGPGDPWWAPVIKGTQDAAKLLNVEVIYLGPEVFSIEKLVELLESAIAAKPDGIIVTITAYEALDEPLRRAIDQGIPVIAVNVPDPRPKPERIPYLGYVGQDEYQAGYKLAIAALEEFEKLTGRPPKKAVIGIHEVGHVGLEMRAKGIQDAFAEKGLPVPEKLDITTEPVKALEILRSYLVKEPDTEIIFTLGPLGAHPAMKLIREENLKGKVYVATVDIDEEILKGIEEGVMLVAISQQPYAQGFLPVVLMYLYVKYGIMPPEHLPTGPTPITKELLEVVRYQIQQTGGA